MGNEHNGPSPTDVVALSKTQALSKKQALLYRLGSWLWSASLGCGRWLSTLVVVVLGKVIKNLMQSSSSNTHMKQNHVTSKMLTTRLFNTIPDSGIEDVDKEAHSMARGTGGMMRGRGGPSCPSSKLVHFSLLHNLSYILTLLQQKTRRHHLSAILQPPKSSVISGVVGFCWPPPHTNPHNPRNQAWCLVWGVFDLPGLQPPSMTLDNPWNRARCSVLGVFDLIIVLY